MLIWFLNGQASGQPGEAVQVMLANVVVECNAILPDGFKRELNTGINVPSDCLKLVAVMHSAFVVAVCRRASVRIWATVQQPGDGRLPINQLSIVESFQAKMTLVGWAAWTGNDSAIAVSNKAFFSMGSTVPLRSRQITYLRSYAYR